MAKRSNATEKTFYVSDALLQEIAEELREKLTPAEAIELMESIVCGAPEEVPRIYRIAFVVKEAYIKGFIEAMGVYREAVKATAEVIKKEGQ